MKIATVSSCVYKLKNTERKFCVFFYNMKKINHELFGELIYDGYWTGKQKITIFGHDRDVNASINLLKLAM
ncbi:Uncharacterized protein BWGO95_02926 [Bacillus mycoides]|uniref:Uncharacterized protein n=1 Tax=Bacillus mycoides TaxID=1405 RepID=A0A1G4ERW7_BACMY|nr:hypothetical protein CQZ94_09065 [Bacillus sp. MYb209]SCB68779.1 Uncharacterized protein BWGO95_02926 [Bacillus mycoides]